MGTGWSLFRSAKYGVGHGIGLVAAVYRMANFSGARFAFFGQFSDEEGGRCEGGLQARKPQQFSMIWLVFFVSLFSDKGVGLKIPLKMTD